MDGNGRTRSWYKAVGDARLHASHWTCIMDVDLESHKGDNIGVPSKNWHLFDDMSTLSSHVPRGWQECQEDRHMVIYARAKGDCASRPLTEKELEGEERRNIEIKHISGEKGRRARWQTPVIHPPDIWWIGAV